MILSQALKNEKNDEEQTFRARHIITVLRECHAGMKTRDLARKQGISRALPKAPWSAPEAVAAATRWLPKGVGANQ